jgi:hypothetical protein
MLTHIQSRQITLKLTFSHPLNQPEIDELFCSCFWMSAVNSPVTLLSD